MVDSTGHLEKYRGERQDIGKPLANCQWRDQETIKMKFGIALQFVIGISFLLSAHIVQGAFEVAIIQHEEIPVDQLGGESMSYASLPFTKSAKQSLAGQIIIDPENSSWLVYNRDDDWTALRFFIEVVVYVIT